MNKQKHWFPGQPNHRNIFDFSQAVMAVKGMPDSFINQDTLFMGNTYESDDGEERYYIIGRNLVDGLYNEIPGTENLFDSTQAEPANCSFTHGTRPGETCSLFIASNSTLIRIGLSRSQVTSFENIETTLPVANFSPVISFMAMGKVILGYIHQVNAISGDCVIVFLKYDKGITSIHHLMPFNTGKTPTQCYIHINKNQYAISLNTQEDTGTVVHTGEIDEHGKFGNFSRTFSSKSTFISTAFSQDNAFLFYPDKSNNVNCISSLRLADGSIMHATTIEDYNMLKLAPDNKIYGLNKDVESKVNNGTRLYATIEILTDNTIETKEVFSKINGGYFPADAMSSISG